MLAGLVLALVDRLIVSRPGIDHTGEVPYYLVIAIIAEGIVTCLSPKALEPLGFAVLDVLLG